MSAAGVCEDCQGPCQPHKRTCKGCFRIRTATSAKEAAARRAQLTAETLAKPWSPYRCRAHHDSIVTPKGKGCRPCLEERATDPDPRVRNR